MANRRTGGEPLWVAPKRLALFFWARIWPQTFLNRRLPRTTQRSVCLLVQNELFETDRQTKHRAGQFAGAACLTGCLGLPRPAKKYARFFGTR
jgi:hypothetical protein